MSFNPDVELERIHNGLVRYQRRLDKVKVWFDEDVRDRIACANMDIGSSLNFLGEALDLVEGKDKP